MQRGAALSDPSAGILLCLVSGDGTALLHRVSRINDPEITEQEVSPHLLPCASALHRAVYRGVWRQRLPPSKRAPASVAILPAWGARTCSPAAALLHLDSRVRPRLC